MKKFTFYIFMCMLLPFLAHTQVLNENFDAASSFPDGWQTMVKSQLGYNIELYTSQYSSTYSKPNSVYFKGTSTGDVIEDTLLLISPQADLTTASKYKVSFYLRGGEGKKLELGTISDPADANTYAVLETFTITEAWNYTCFETFISPDQITHLAFKRVSGYLYMDDILVEAVLPYNLQIEKLSGVECMPGSSVVEYKYLVENTGLNDATINLELTSALTTEIRDKSGLNVISSILVKSLTQDTIIARISTDAIQNGSKVETISLKGTVFESADITSTLDLSINTYAVYKGIDENFDSSLEIPDNWQVLSNSLTGKSTIIVKADYSTASAPNSVKYTASTSDANLFMTLVTPQIDLTEQSKYKVTFQLYGYKDDQIELGFLTDPTDASTFQSLEIITVTTGYVYNFIKTYVSANNLGFLAFKYVKGDVKIDNIKVEPVLPYALELEQLGTLETIVSNTIGQFKFLVRNSGSSNATFNLSVQSDLQYKILDKTGENEISLIQLNGLEYDTIQVNVTAPEIEEGQVIKTFTLGAEIAENTDLKQSLSIDFSTYLPYVEIEEGFEINALPFAWQMSNPDLVKIYKSSSSAHSGECYAQLNKSTTKDTGLLITPAIKAYNGTYKISAWLKGSDPVEVGKITDLNDWSTYQTIGEVTGSGYSYTQVQINNVSFENNTHFVFKFIGVSSYSKAIIDDIDIEKDQEYSVDIKTDFTERNTYTGTSVIYPLYIINNGLKDETYNISVDCSWQYKILDSDSLTEVISQLIEFGKTDTAYIQITAPSEGIMNGQEGIAKIKVECQDNADNYETRNFVTKAYSYSTYLNEDFENIGELPVNWCGYADGYSTVGLSAYDFYEGMQCIKIYQSSSATNASYFSTPLFKASEYKYNISFWARVSNGPENLLVGTLTDAEDYNTYENIGTFELTSVYQEYAMSNITLSEAKAFVFASEAGGKSIFVDNIVISQVNTSVEFNPDEGTELSVVNPDLFISFSKPVMLDDGSEITQENISTIVQLRKETVDGENIALNYSISEDKQTIKSSPVQYLNGTSYHLVLNDGFKDINGVAVNSASVHFIVEDFFAPEFVESYPVLENIGETIFDIKVQATENATVYYMLVENGETAPTAAEIKAGTNYGSVQLVKAGNKQVLAKTNEVIVVNELTSCVSYDIYLTLEDNAANLQETVTKLTVQTLDLTAPEFNDGYPVIDNIKETSLDIKVQANENGKVYYILITEGSDAPNITQVMSGADYGTVQVISKESQAMEVNTIVIFNVENLESEKNYDVYIAVEDNLGNVNETIEKLNTTTLDLTAPEFLSDYPMIDAVKETSFDVKVQSTEAGTAYFMLVANEAIAPTANEIKLGSNYGSVTVLNTGSLVSKVREESVASITNLSSNTDFDLYLTIEDDKSNLQQAVTKLEVKTLISTSIENVELRIEICPNPATDYIKISTIENIKTYMLLNSIGNVVRIGNGKGTNEIINISSLNSGVYFVVIETITGEEKVQKILVK